MADSQPSTAPKKISLLRSFRGAHVLLKLSFMVTIVLGCLLMLELGAYLIYQNNYAQLPVYFQSLSGYRVFSNTPGYQLYDGIAKEDDEPNLKTDERGLLSSAPVARKKPEGVIRIVVTGGSALAGAGQTSGYEDVHFYPRGTYAWRPSISGQLERYLREQLPNETIEILNAAHNNKALHQNLIHYAESLCEYDADVLVSMDGFNELSTLCSDEPYQRWEDMWLEAYAGLYDKSKGIGGADKFYLTRLLSMFVERTHEALRSGVAPPPPSEPFSEEELRATWEKYKPDQTRRADRWLQILRQFAAIVRADDVGLVFALQPMTSRVTNKQRSEIEQGFDKRAIPRHDDAGGDAGVTFPTLRFLWDDYLTERIAKVIGDAQGTYIDLGIAMQELGPDMEFYTDYCHMTPAANTWVAQQLGEAVLGELRKRGRIQ